MQRKRILVWVLVSVLVIQTVTQIFAADSTPVSVSDLDAPAAVFAPGSVEIPAVSLKPNENAETQLSSYLDKSDVLLWKNEEGSLSAHFCIEEAGKYQIALEYAGLPGRSNPIGFEVLIDGRQLTAPDGEGVFELPRYFEDASEVILDAQGDELAPEQREVYIFRAGRPSGVTGSDYDPVSLTLAVGEHTLELRAVEEPFALARILLEPVRETPTYDEYIAAYDDVPRFSGQPLMIEAEAARYKTTAYMAPLADDSAPGVSPSSTSHKRINYIGGANWSNPGEQMTWILDVPETGLYVLQFYFKQAAVLGGTVYRSLYVDGVLPFAEAHSMAFDYGLDWQSGTFRNEEGPYLLYLTKGIHSVEMAVSLGAIGAEVAELEDQLYSIGEIYRDISSITGDVPDANRDYDLFRQIPDLEQRLSDAYEALQKIAQQYEEKTGKKGGTNPASIRSMADVIGLMLDNRYTAHKYKQNFYNKYASLGAVVNDFSHMPLSLDRIAFSAPGDDAGIRKVTWSDKALFSVKRFLASFQSKTDSQQGEITLWVNWGREQTQVLNHLIQSDFTPKTGIKVNVKLSNGNMVQGILSGNGPDLTLSMPRTEPVNLAMRGQMADLRQFDDLNEVLKRFMPDADKPYRFGDGLYALPSTQTFNMLFYRTDIFADMGLAVPETWDEFIQTYSLLQKKNLQAYLPYTSISTAASTGAAVSLGSGSNLGAGALSIFPTLLKQKGGSLYQEDGKATNWTTPEAFDAFSMWTEFYTDYKFPVTADFYNRFRSGLMPMGVTAYTMYSTLTVAAPEIRGKWAMAEIPGIRQADGSIDRSQAGGGTGCGILENSHNKEAAWELLKWWTSEDIQLRYSNSVEAILGVSGRIATANVGAMQRLPWDKNSVTVLLKQWEQVDEVPEVPGGYFTAQAIDQAYWNVVNNNEDARKMLLEWGIAADAEITRKRAEFQVE